MTRCFKIEIIAPAGQTPDRKPFPLKRESLKLGVASMAVSCTGQSKRCAASQVHADAISMGAEMGGIGGDFEKSSGLASAPGQGSALP